MRCYALPFSSAMTDDTFLSDIQTLCVYRSITRGRVQLQIKQIDQTDSTTGS